MRHADPSSPASELSTAIASLLPYFTRAGWITAACGILLLAPSVYMLEVYDRVIGSRSEMTLAMLTLLVAGVYAVIELLSLARGRILHAAGVELDRQLGARVFTASVEAARRQLPLRSGTAMSDLRTLREFFDSPGLQAAMESPLAVIFLVAVFFIHPVLGWAAVVGALLQLLLSWTNERDTFKPLASAARSAREAQARAEGATKANASVHAMGMAEAMRSRCIERHREFLADQALASDRAGANRALGKFLQFTMSSLLIGLGAWLVLRAQLQDTGALLIMSSILGGRALAPLVMLMTQWRTITMVREVHARIAELLAQVPPRGAQMPMPKPRGALQIESLVFTPPGTSAPVLKGIAFAVAPGETVAIIGPSAAGKSTLGQLIVGLWPATGGKVRLDGADVHAWDKTELGPWVGYLPQEIELLDGTLAENIARFGAPDRERLDAAVAGAGLGPMIEALPGGLECRIAADGVTLSPGQRQRVGLARALYGQPPLVVLDEPDASLDAEGKAMLQSALAALKAAGSTCVLITHRPSLLATVDKIAVLREGHLAAFGPTQSVLAALRGQGAQAPAQRLPAQPPARPALRGQA